MSLHVSGRVEGALFFGEGFHRRNVGGASRGQETSDERHEPHHAQSTYEDRQVESRHMEKHDLHGAAGEPSTDKSQDGSGSEQELGPVRRKRTLPASGPALTNGLTSRRWGRPVYGDRRIPRALELCVSPKSAGGIASWRIPCRSRESLPREYPASEKSPRR